MKNKDKGNKRKSQSVAPKISLNAAGIDIGATEHYVCVAQERSEDNVRSFGTFTEDLHKMADWLVASGISTVAMESTGVYWIPLYQILECRGLEVCLVNARHVKNVPGRKTDVQDCQWLQYLHSVGLLEASFRPEDQVCQIRSILRHRTTLVELSSQHVLRMQKSLDQMNIQLHHVISDITGVTGLKIIDAILAGQRDVHELAQLKNSLIKASESTIAKSLQGDYREEHLFVLRQSLEMYREISLKIQECDKMMENQLAGFADKTDLCENPLPKPKKRKKVHARDPKFDFRKEFYRISGVDLTAIDGVNAMTTFSVFTELGTDVTKFANSKRFASWLGLCPNNKISGGKVLGSATRQVRSRLAGALRMSASTLKHSKSQLGDYFRTMRSRHGPAKAINICAHKLARIIYTMLKERVPYNETSFAEDAQKQEKRKIANLKRTARYHGFELVDIKPIADMVS